MLTRDELGVIVSVDEAVTEMLGFSAQELVGCSVLDLVHPEDRARAADSLAARRPGGRAQPGGASVRLRHRRRDGSWTWLEASSELEAASGGTLARTRLIDVTDEVDALERLQASQRSSARALSLLEALESSAPIGIAFLDAELRFARVNDTFAALAGRSRDELLGRRPAEVSPGAWGELERVRGEPAHRREPLVNLELGGTLEATGRPFTWLVSSYPVEVEGELQGFGVLLVDITERKEAEERQRQLARAAIGALATTSERRDPYTAGHHRGVAELATALALELGVEAAEVEGVTMAANIHDIGKIAVPIEILAKPGRLTALEMELVKSHSRVGYEIVAGIELPWPVAQMILQHHERMDGSGYPAGLSGEAILPGARVIAVADVVEAMANHRPYRPALGLDEALQEISAGRERLYDEAAAEACLRLFAEGRFCFGRGAGAAGSGAR